jgi:hypothetical protein
MLTVYSLFNLPQQFVKPIVTSASRNLQTFCESLITLSRVTDVIWSIKVPQTTG